MLPIGQCLRDELVRRDYAASTVRGYTQTEGSNPLRIVSSPVPARR
jgi:hypothetical protein